MEENDHVFFNIVFPGQHTISAFRYSTCTNGNGTIYVSIEQSVDSLAKYNSDICRGITTVSLKNESNGSYKASIFKSSHEIYIPISLLLGRILLNLHQVKDDLVTTIELTKFVVDSLSEYVLCPMQGIEFTNHEGLDEREFLIRDTMNNAINLATDNTTVPGAGMKDDPTKSKVFVEAYRTMRQYVPTDIFQLSLEVIVKQGLPRLIAERIWKNKILWLLCMHPSDIAKVHIGDLRGKYLSHGLDIVEMRAVWYVLPDWPGRTEKAQWRRNFRDKLDSLEAAEASGSLSSSSQRSVVYAGFERLSLYDPDKPLRLRFVSGSDVFVNTHIKPSRKPSLVDHSNDILSIVIPNANTIVSSSTSAHSNDARTRSRSLSAVSNSLSSPINSPKSFAAFLLKHLDGGGTGTSSDFSSRVNTPVVRTSIHQQHGNPNDSLYNNILSPVCNEQKQSAVSHTPSVSSQFTSIQAKLMRLRESAHVSTNQKWKIVPSKTRSLNRSLHMNTSVFSDTDSLENSYERLDIAGRIPFEDSAMRNGDAMNGESSIMVGKALGSSRLMISDFVDSPAHFHTQNHVDSVLTPVTRDGIDSVPSTARRGLSTSAWRSVASSEGSTADECEVISPITPAGVGHSHTDDADDYTNHISNIKSVLTPSLLLDPSLFADVSDDSNQVGELMSYKHDAMKELMIFYSLYDETASGAVPPHSLQEEFSAADEEEEVVGKYESSAPTTVVSNLQTKHTEKAARTIANDKMIVENYNGNDGFTDSIDALVNSSSLNGSPTMTPRRVPSFELSQLDSSPPKHTSTVPVINMNAFKNSSTVVASKLPPRSPLSRQRHEASFRSSPHTHMHTMSPHVTLSTAPALTPHASRSRSPAADANATSGNESTTAMSTPSGISSATLSLQSSPSPAHALRGLAKQQSHYAYRVMIQSADNLLQNGSKSPSPYCNIYLVDSKGCSCLSFSPHCQTRVEKCTQSPEWHTAFVLRLTDSYSGPAPVGVMLEVKDSSSGMLFHRHIGQVVIPVSCFLVDTEAQFCLPLEPFSYNKFFGMPDAVGEIRVLTELVKVGSVRYQELYKSLSPPSRANFPSNLDHSIIDNSHDSTLDNSSSSGADDNDSQSKFSLSSANGNSHSHNNIMSHTKKPSALKLAAGADAPPLKRTQSEEDLMIETEVDNYVIPMEMSPITRKRGKHDQLLIKDLLHSYMDGILSHGKRDDSSQRHTQRSPVTGNSHSPLSLTAVMNKSDAFKDISLAPTDYAVENASDNDNVNDYKSNDRVFSENSTEDSDDTQSGPKLDIVHVFHQYVPTQGNAASRSAIGNVQKIKSMFENNEIMYNQEAVDSLLLQYCEASDRLSEPFELLILLVDSFGADVTCRNIDGATPLHLLFNKPLLGRYILLRGGDILAVNRYSESVLQMCLDYDYDWIISAFESTGAEQSLLQDVDRVESSNQYIRLLFRYGRYLDKIKDMLDKGDIVISPEFATEIIEEMKEEDCFKYMSVNAVETFELLESLTQL